MMFSLVLVVSMLGEAWAGSVAALEAQGGFRDLKWGSPPTAEMLPVAAPHADYSVYHRKGDMLSVGTARLSDMVYMYWKRQLCSVTMYAASSTDSRALMMTFQHAYGNPVRAPGSIERYMWLGTTTDLTASVKPETSTVIAVFSYEPLYKLAREALASAGAKDL